MKRLFFILLLLIPVCTFAQVIDSLEIELGTKRTPTEKAEILELIALEYESRFEYDKSVSRLLQAILTLESEPEPNYQRISELKIGIGNFYAYMYEYEVSTRYYLEAISTLETNEGATLKAGAFGNIAQNYREMEDTKRARNYYYQSIELIEQKETSMDQLDSSFLSFSYLNLATLYAEDGDADSADYYIQAAGTLTDTSNFFQKFQHLISEIQVSTELERLDLALDLLEEFNRDTTEEANQLDQSWYYMMLGNVNIRKHEFEQALVYLDSAIDFADQSRNKLEKIDMLELKEQCYLGLAQYDSAFIVRNAYTNLSDSLIRPQVLHNMFAAMADHQVGYLKEKQRVEEMNADKDLEIKQNYIYITLVIIGFMAFLSILVYLRNQHKKKLADAKLYAAELEEEKLGHKLKYRSNELSNLALFISNNIAFIDKIKNQLREVEDFFHKQELNEIVQLIDEGFNLEEEKKDLEHKILQANEAFYDRLDNLGLSLTKREKQICSLLVLNLSSKEISGILNVQVASIEKSRYRLRKKLELDRGVDLVRYLRLV